jgi:hypothetical protein
LITETRQRSRAQVRELAWNHDLWKERTETLITNIAPALDLIEPAPEGTQGELPPPTTFDNVFERSQRAYRTLANFAQGVMTHAVQRAMGILQSHYDFIDVGRVQMGYAAGTDPDQAEQLNASSQAAAEVVAHDCYTWDEGPIEDNDAVAGEGNPPV